MLKNRTWLALITFCATSALVTALGLALLFATATVAFALAQSLKSTTSQEVAPAGQTFVGMITDAECGARHPQDSGKRPAECARDCVRKGSKYILVNGDKSYTLDGNSLDLYRLAGQRVTVAGMLDGNTIKVDSALQ